MTTTVTVPLNAYRGEREAHNTVTAQAASDLYRSNGIDWPVSGDATRIAWGKRGSASVAKRVNIWQTAN